MVTPYFAVFGREAMTTPLMEGPKLPVTVPQGQIFVRTLHGRISDIHQHLNEQAQEIRQMRVEKRNYDEYLNRPPKRPIRVGDYVWMIYRDWERASYMRKHGRGMPWKRKFLVVEVPKDSPYGVRLDVSGTKGVIPWQSVRRLTLAPPGTHHPSEASQMAPVGEYYANKRATTQETEDPNRPKVEQIVDAQWMESDYSITVKWEGLSETTLETHARAQQVCTTPELKEQLRRAIKIADARMLVEPDSPEMASPEESGQHGQAVYTVYKKDGHGGGMSRLISMCVNLYQYYSNLKQAILQC